MGQLPKCVPILLCAPLIRCHRVREIRVEWSYQKSLGSLNDVDLVSRAEVESVEHGFGEDGGDRTAKFRELLCFYYFASPK